MVTRWESALSDLVATRGDALTAYAYVLCGDRVQSADLVQEALLRTFSRIRLGADIDSLEAYVRRAILTVHLDDHRRRRRWHSKRHLFVGPADRRASDDSVVTADTVQAALARLSPRQRACVVLRYYEDLPVAAVAAELGCRQGTVKRHLADARVRLTEALGAVEETREETRR